MKFESPDELEQALWEALVLRPAPPGLKGRLMEKRRVKRSRTPVFGWRWLAASVALAAVLAGGYAWHDREEQIKGEAARQQVLTALRITSHALNRMNTQLAAHGHVNQE